MTTDCANRPAGWAIRARGRAGAFALLLLLLPAAAGAVDVRVFTVADGLPSNQVTALAPAPDGTLWIGTGNAGAYLLDPVTGKGRGYRVADGLSSDEVTSIALFGGKVYVGTEGGLSVFDGTGWSRIDTADNVTMRSVRLAASPDGKELWACSFDVSGGTVRFDGKDWRFMGGEGRGLFNNVKGFAFLPEGVLMASHSGAAYLRKGRNVVTLKEGLPAANLFAAAATSGKWVVGSSRGLYRYDGKWQEMRLVPGAPGFAVFDLSTRSEILFAGTVKGLYRIDGKKVSALSEKDGLPDAVVTAVAAGSGYVAAGSARGVALVRGW